MQLWRYQISRAEKEARPGSQCEVCGFTLVAETMFLQREERTYREPPGGPVKGWTGHGCTSGLFGHRSCLVEWRKEPVSTWNVCPNCEGKEVYGNGPDAKELACPDCGMQYDPDEQDRLILEGESV